MNKHHRLIVSARRHVWQGERLGWRLYAESWRQTLAKLEATYTPARPSPKTAARDAEYARTVTLQNLPRGSAT